MGTGRNTSRHDTQWEARCASGDNLEAWEECSIINVSRKGMGVKFRTRKTFLMGTSVHLEVSVSTRKTAVKVKGVLKWTKQKRNMSVYIGGVELTDSLDDNTFEDLRSF